MVGWMDHGLRGQKGNIFIYVSITRGMGVNFLITNRINRQIKTLGMKGNKRVMKQA